MPSVSRCNRLASLLVLLSLSTVLGYEPTIYTEISCDSRLVVDYGDIVMNEAYSLTINPGKQSVTVVCLADDPKAEPLPEWLECNAEGFEITGKNAKSTTISMAV